MEIQVIPASNASKNNKKRVCAYCRVSTIHDEQENSLENQIDYYKNLIKNNPAYEYVGVYFDNGISGFKSNRPGFQEMMNEARNGNIELIITKSISRFARNTLTMIQAIRELKDLGVGVYFELQNINTLTQAGELLITIIAAFAQAESDNYSEMAKQRAMHMAEQGQPNPILHRCFGYRKVGKGKFEPDPYEAKWVKRIYEMLIDGKTTGEIANYLNEKGVKSKRGNEFTYTTVRTIIKNEAYMGDRHVNKLYRNSERKTVKNKGQVDSLYIRDAHQGIVSRSVWNRAQEIIVGKGGIYGKIYSAQFGYPVRKFKHVHSKEVFWRCSGQKRYGVKFCPGIKLSDAEIAAFGNRDEPIYVQGHRDKRIEPHSISKKEWDMTNTKKPNPAMLNAPDLTRKNYPYMNNIFCAKCRNKLTRVVRPNGLIIWICMTWKERGVKHCEVLNIPDKIIRDWGVYDQDLFIERKIEQNGKTNYSYTSQAPSSKESFDKGGKV